MKHHRPFRILDEWIIQQAGDDGEYVEVAPYQTYQTEADAQTEADRLNDIEAEANKP
jgi:hypothetical protein